MNKNHIFIIAGVIALMGATAAIASYATRESMKPESVATVEVQQPVKTHRAAATSERRVAYNPQPTAVQQPACNDNNIVGTIAGGAAGGLLGSQIGKGNGKTAAAVAGAIGGGMVGNKYMPTHNITCR